MEAQSKKGYMARALDGVMASLGPLRDIFSDESVNEIQINGPSDIFVRRGGKDVKVDLVLSRHSIEAAISAIASINDREVGERQRRYILSARLPGLRVEAVLPPVAIKGPSMCIRRHSTRIIGLDEYVDLGTSTLEQVNLIRTIIKNNENFLVAGGTYSGKTTLINSLIREMDSKQRLFIIEQVHELKVDNPNCVLLECDPEEGVTARRAVRVGMRYSPNRIILGELRGEEGLDFLNACNTGHPGSCSTIHADSAKDALGRLEDLVLQAEQLPYEAIQNRIGSSIRWVIHIAMENGSRSIDEIVRVDGFDRATKKYVFTDFTKGVSYDVSQKSDS